MTTAATRIGKPCVKCGSNERYKVSGYCAPCDRKHSREYRIANIEWSRQSARDRYEQRKEDQACPPTQNAH